MRHLYTSTNDNMFIYNLWSAGDIVRSRDHFNEYCPVLRVRNLFGCLQTSTKIIQHMSH